MHNLSCTTVHKPRPVFAKKATRRCANLLERLRLPDRRSKRPLENDANRRVTPPSAHQRRATAANARAGTRHIQQLRHLFLHPGRVVRLPPNAAARATPPRPQGARAAHGRHPRPQPEMQDAGAIRRLITCPGAARARARALDERGCGALEERLGGEDGLPLRVIAAARPCDAALQHDGQWRRLVDHLAGARGAHGRRVDHVAAQQQRVRQPRAQKQREGDGRRKLGRDVQRGKRRMKGSTSIAVNKVAVHQHGDANANHASKHNGHHDLATAHERVHEGARRAHGGGGAMRRGEHVEVHAAAEGARGAGGGEHDEARAVVVADGAQRGGGGVVQRDVERVESARAVERQLDHALAVRAAQQYARVVIVAVAGAVARLPHRSRSRRSRLPCAPSATLHRLASCKHPRVCVRTHASTKSSSFFVHIQQNMAATTQRNAT
ncbi:Enoyl-CoA hydratase/isomerase [Gracilaria domingensis]|nr:Enoyl-CoA hydratase/isomerase [Gracilaria domingensis]